MQRSKADLTCASLSLLRAIRLGSILSVGPSWKIERLTRVVDLPGARKADLVRVFVDSKHSAQVPMMAPEKPLESPTQEIHKNLHSLSVLHAPVDL
jgi:hypothetical protein